MEFDYKMISALLGILITFIWYFYYIRDIYKWENKSHLLEEIFKIKKFNKDLVLKEINEENSILENNAMKNNVVTDFIENNLDKYLFFTNLFLSLDFKKPHILLKLHNIYYFL